MKYNNIRDNCFGKYCRQCINDTYHRKLRTQDCMYLIYPSKCAKCGTIKNIVSGVRVSGFLKLIL